MDVDVDVDVGMGMYVGSMWTVDVLLTFKILALCSFCIMVG